MAHWTGKGNAEVLRWRGPALPLVQDDFVQVPLPRLASADPNKGATAEAVRNYEEEAKIVDARLFRKVTLRCKSESLETICENLTAQTGVRIQASRGVRDEKATVFVEDRPAREVMRALARLFGYLFSRSGDPNAYRYELLQDLRSQLAEEELRNRDLHEALINLDEAMGRFRPYLNRNLDELIQRVERQGDGKNAEANLLFRFVKGGGWGPAQVYFRISPAERAALFAGQTLRYSVREADADRRLPAEWRDMLLKSSGLRLFPGGAIIENIDPSKPSTPIHEVPTAEPEVTLELKRSEAGVLSLWVGTHVTATINGSPSGGGATWEMANGRSPSTAQPENAKANAALKKEPLFQRTIDLEPRPSCPRLAEEGERQKKGGPDEGAFVLEPELREPHVQTADVWEEIHRRTGLPVVADAYTHLFPLRPVTFKRVSTFDVLAQAGDALGVRWKKDGAFLLGRSSSFFWDKLKEVPNRYLRRWQESRDRRGELPLEDLLEMVGLTEEQLGSKTVGLGITHCWGLDEWGIIGGGPFIGGEIVPEVLRKQARALRVLNPAQLQQVQTEAGLSLEALTPTQKEVISRDLGWTANPGSASRLQVLYIPRGQYIWQPVISQARYELEAKRWPRIFAKTADAALARAQRVDPEARRSDIKRTRGRLDVLFIMPDGQRIGPGGPLVLAPLE